MRQPTLCRSPQTSLLRSTGQDQLKPGGGAERTPKQERVSIEVLPLCEAERCASPMGGPPQLHICKTLPSTCILPFIWGDSVENPRKCQALQLQLLTKQKALPQEQAKTQCYPDGNADTRPRGTSRPKPVIGRKQSCGHQEWAVWPCTALEGMHSELLRCK